MTTQSYRGFIDTKNVCGECNGTGWMAGPCPCKRCMGTGREKWQPRMSKEELEELLNQALKKKPLKP